MKKEIFVPLLVVYCISSGNLVNGLAQQNNVEHWSKVGGFKLLHRGYGVLSTARHINKESTFTDYVGRRLIAFPVPAVTKFSPLEFTAPIQRANAKRSIWSV